MRNNNERSIFSGGGGIRRLPLVGEQKRVGRDLIVVVEIIAGRLNGEDVYQ